MAAGIVSTDQDQAAVDAAVGKAEQGIRRHIDADHLHGGQGPAADHRHADRCFQRNFLIRRPFSQDIVLELRDVFQNFRAGRSRIGRGVNDAGLPGALRDGFVARQQFFHHPRSFPGYKKVCPGESDPTARQQARAIEFSFAAAESARDTITTGRVAPRITPAL